MCCILCALECILKTVFHLDLHAISTNNCLSYLNKHSGLSISAHQTTSLPALTNIYAAQTTPVRYLGRCYLWPFSKLSQ